MEKELKLRQPLMVNGKKRSILKYDFDEIDSDAFLRATSNSLSKMKEGRAGVAEIDYALHLYLAFEAIMISETEVDNNDLMRIKGYDLAQAVKLGRDFFIGSEETSQESGLEPSSESTQGNSTPQSPISGPGPSKPS